MVQMVNQPPTTTDWADGTEYTFGQIYHTPISILYYRLSGIANGDHSELAPWFQCIYSAHMCRNSDAAAAGDVSSIEISGGQWNCGTVIIFHDPTAHAIYDIKVIGHKAQGAAGLS